LEGLSTELVYFGIKKTIDEKNGVNIENHVEKKLHIKIKINGKNKMEKISIGTDSNL
jgi:hypothetical protein